MKPRLLDLFCGGGGASMGYHRAGFEVVGVDIYPQPHYPFEFQQADAIAVLNGVALEYDLRSFDAIHASPPCQAYSQATRNLWGAGRAAEKHPDLIAPVRDLLNAIGLPYVIENVPNAPLRAQLLLCGTMFEETNIRKHRYFEANWPMPMAPASCGDHSDVYNPWKGARGVRTADKHRAAMGIDWLPEAGGASRKQAVRTGADLNEAIPPAFTEYIGRALLDYMARELAA